MLVDELIRDEETSIKEKKSKAQEKEKKERAWFLTHEQVKPVTVIENEL